MSQIQVPEGWELTKLGDIGEYKYGYNGKATSDNSGKPYLRITDINFDGSIKPDRVFVQISDDDFKRYRLKKNDIVIARTGATVGKSFLFNEGNDFVFASYLIRYRFDKEKIVPTFLYYVLQSPSFWKYIGISQSASAQPNVNATKMSKFEFSLPPMGIQKKIVKKLDQILKKLAIQRKEILELQKKKTDYIKYFLKNVIGYLFESLLKNENCSTIKLNELILNIKLGSNQKSISNGPGIPVLRMPNIKNGKIDYSDLKYTKFSEKDEEKYLLQKNDILVNRTNSPELVGKSAVFEKNEKFAFASYIIRLRVNEKIVNPHFLVNYLNSVLGRNYIESVYVKTAGQANINSEHLKSMQLFLPELDKQNSIVDELYELQIKSEYFRKKLKNFETFERKTKNYLAGLINSILDNAFSGKLVN